MARCQKVLTFASAGIIINNYRECPAWATLQISMVAHDHADIRR